MKWLCRDLIVGPYLTLATSEKAFQKVMRHCNVPVEQWGRWINEGANATAHTLNQGGKLIFVVCIQPEADTTPIQIAALLVHESVHVWQQFRQSIGETNPSSEFEAYSIQAIAQCLMQAYADQMPVSNTHAAN